MTDEWKPCQFCGGQDYIEMEQAKKELEWTKAELKVACTMESILKEALGLITALAIDFDGYRSTKGLKKLIDEMAEVAGMALRGERVLVTPEEYREREDTQETTRGRAHD